MSELSPETEELLERGRAGASMSRAHRDELKGAVLAKLATGAIVTSSTTAAAWTLTTKVIGVATFAAVVGAGSIGVVKYRAHARASQNATQTSVASTATTQSSPATALSAAITNAAPTALAIAPQIQAPVPIADPIPTTPSNPVAVTANPSTSQNSLNSPAIVNAASNGASGNNFGTNNSAPSSITPTSPNTTSPSTNPITAATPHTSSLEEETTLLRAAHDALAAGDPAGALRLLDEHAARFPNSMLEPERSAERVFAYCAEQNTRYARAAAGSFLAAHPTGPLAVRVRSSCGARYEK